MMSHKILIIVSTHGVLAFFEASLTHYYKICNQRHQFNIGYKKNDVKLFTMAFP